MENAGRHVAEGWKFVRWGLADAEPGNVLEPGRAIPKAIKEVEAVRTAVGEEIELCFDIHTRLDPPDAIRLCRAVEQYHPFFMEGPIRSEACSPCGWCGSTSAPPRRGRAVPP